MKPARALSRLRGFTLLELVVATTITVSVLMICYQLLGSTLAACDRVERRSRPDKIGEAIMALIRRDLQGALWYELGDMVFLAEPSGAGDEARDQVHFLTTSKPIYSITNELSMGFWTGVTSVSYILHDSPEVQGCHTLFRRESLELGDSPFETGTYFEVYGKVKFLRLLYFDGYEWTSEWDSVGRREQYEADMETSIEEFIDEATGVGTGVDKVKDESSLGKNLGGLTGSGLPSSAGASSSATRTSSRRLGSSTAAAGAEGEEGSLPLLPLPNWGVPQAVKIELGILAGSERDVYREGYDPNSAAKVYTYSATVTIPSGTVVRMTANVPAEAGAAAGPLVALPGKGEGNEEEPSRVLGAPPQKTDPSGSPPGPSPSVKREGQRGRTGGEAVRGGEPGGRSRGPGARGRGPGVTSGGQGGRSGGQGGRGVRSRR